MFFKDMNPFTLSSRYYIRLHLSRLLNVTWLSVKGRIASFQSHSRRLNLTTDNKRKNWIFPPEKLAPRAGLEPAT